MTLLMLWIFTKNKLGLRSLSVFSRSSNAPLSS